MHDESFYILLGMNWMWVGIGGAAGSILRFYFQSRIQVAFASAFPWGTLAVNLAGSAVIGMLAGLFDSLVIPTPARLFLFVGILGGFTTFSAYSLENVNLLRLGQIRVLLVNVVLSNALGIGLALAGYLLCKVLFRGLGPGAGGP